MFRCPQATFGGQELPLCCNCEVWLSKYGLPLSNQLTAPSEEKVQELLVQYKVQ